MSGNWAPAQAPDGRTYYYHKDTKEVTWEKPADFDGPELPPAEDLDADPANWGEATAADGRTYYYNRKTQKTVWERPDALERQQQLAAASAGPTFVAGGSGGYGDRQDFAGQERRDDRNHGLPQKPSFDGPRGMPWEQSRPEATGFRGAMPSKADEPDYASPEAAEEAFFKLLKRSNITAESAWRDALSSIVREREYRAIKDPKDRKQAFEKYCQMVRVQEKEKEKERKERQRADFREMLSTHDDVKPYTRWRTAKPLVEREAVFKSVGSDEDRKRMFEEYILELKKKHLENESARRRKALDELDIMLQALVVDPDTKWEDAHDTITSNERFISDPTFKGLHNIDIIQAFDSHVKALERVANDERQKQRSLRVRRERQARDDFLQLLGEKIREGQIDAETKWQDLYPLIAKDERYLAYLGTSGSSPLDLFRDIVVDEEQKLRSKRHTALDVLIERRYEITVDTTFEQFAEIMRSHPKTQNLMTDHEMRLVYQKSINQVKSRKEAHSGGGEKRQQDAIDALRHQMKKLEPPVRVEDSYEEVMQRLAGHKYYDIADEDARHIAFDKFKRRLKEKEDDFARERSRRDREHDRDHRNGSRSRRDHDRDRGRRHRTRTPEIDAYKDDRLKAQADRERQYRKASFGLTPPPRDRRDDRYERDRRPDRHEGLSVYDRERRERDMERERTYVSRADPRDKGKTLDYGDEDTAGSRPSSIHKRRGSDTSAGSRRDTKRSRRERRTRSPEAEGVLKEEPPALQSGSEEGEIEEL